MKHMIHCGNFSNVPLADVSMAYTFVMRPFHKFLDDLHTIHIDADLRCWMHHVTALSTTSIIIIHLDIIIWYID